MKRFFIASALALSLCTGLCAQNYVPSAENIAAREQFSKDRFGVFIHWGLYAMLAQGEWVMNVKNLDYREYPRLADGFYPSKFDAKSWVRAIKASGAKYITITSRHHDGFSLFKTEASPYNVVDATPFGRDILAELAEACREEGIRLHFYYSHLDWGREDYPLGRTGQGTGRPEGASDWRHYMDFVNTQLTELLTNYGPIGAIWFDGVWDQDTHPRDEQPAIWNLDEQYSLIHRLQPSCLVGNNHHLLPFEGEDIQIFERDIPGRNDFGLSGQDISALPLETCQTMNRSWGYNITDKQYKSADDLIRYLVKTAGKGANLLLNIGPRPDGTLPEEALERLDAMGRWLEEYGESIYDTTAGILPEQDWGVSTQRGSELYLHVLEDVSEIALPVKRVRNASLLAGGNTVKTFRKDGQVIVQIPARPAGTPDMVIKVTLK